MADLRASRAVTATLDGTNVDTVTLQPGNTAHAYVLEITNHDGTGTIWFTWDWTGNTPATPVAEADDVLPVLPGTTKAVRLPQTTRECVVAIVGNGEKYTAAVVPPCD